MEVNEWVTNRLLVNTTEVKNSQCLLRRFTQAYTFYNNVARTQKDPMNLTSPLGSRVHIIDKELMWKGFINVVK